MKNLAPARFAAVAALLLLFGGLAATPVRAQLADNAAKNPDNSIEKQPILREPASPGAGSAANRPSNTSLTGSFDSFRVTLALAGVIVLILMLRAGMRKVFPGAVPNRAAHAVRVHSRTPLSPRNHLLLVQVGRRLLVVVEGQSGLNMLCQISEPEEISALLAQIHEESASTWRFDSLFGKARKPYEAQPSDDPSKPQRASDAPFDQTHELNDPALADTRRELDALTDKVRDMSRQLGTP